MLAILCILYMLIFTRCYNATKWKQDAKFENNAILSLNDYYVILKNMTHES